MPGAKLFLRGAHTRRTHTAHRFINDPNLCKLKGTISPQALKTRLNAAANAQSHTRTWSDRISFAQEGRECFSDQSRRFIFQTDTSASFFLVAEESAFPSHEPLRCDLPHRLIAHVSAKRARCLMTTSLASRV